MEQRCREAIVLGGILLTSACAGGGSACVPGQTQRCVCPDGASGAQACGADGQGWGACECPTGGGIVLTERTRLPEDDPALLSVKVHADSIIFTYDADADPGAFAPGDVVVGALDGGYLRTVDLVESDGRRLVLRTSGAILTDAVEEGIVRWTTGGGEQADRDPEDGATGGVQTSELPLELAVPVAPDLSGREVFSDVVGGADVRVWLPTARLSMLPRVVFEAEVRGARIVAAEAYVATDLELVLEAALTTGAGVSYSTAVEVPVARFPMAGPPPLSAADLVVSVELGFEMDASGTAEVRAAVT